MHARARFAVPLLIACRAAEAVKVSGHGGMPHIVGFIYSSSLLIYSQLHSLILTTWPGGVGWKEWGVTREVNSSAALTQPNSNLVTAVLETKFRESDFSSEENLDVKIGFDELDSGKRLDAKGETVKFFCHTWESQMVRICRARLCFRGIRLQKSRQSFQFARDFAPI